MRTMFVVLLCLLFTTGGVAQGRVPTEQPHRQSSPPLVRVMPWVHPLAAEPSVVHDAASLPPPCDLPFSGIHTATPAPWSDPGLDAHSWRPFDLPTIGVQTLFGAVGAGIFTAVGIGVMHSGGLDELAAGIFVMYLGGSMVGVPLGVLFGGDVMGGEANTAAVLAGSALGTATGIIAFITGNDFPVANTVYIAASFAGPLLGYHLSATSSEERARRDGLNGLALRHRTGARCGSDAFAPRPEIDPLTPGPDFQLPLIALRF